MIFSAKKFLNWLVAFLSALGWDHLLADGNCDRIDRAGVTVVREGIAQNQFGTTVQTMRIYLPAGFGVATEPFSRKTQPCAVVNNVFVGNNDLPTSLILRKEHFMDTVPTDDAIYPLPDRIPVRFETESITWTSATGSFTFQTTEELQYRDQLQLVALEIGISLERPGAEPAASNGLYCLGARGLGRTYEFRARAGGAASFHEVEIDLDPYKFGALPLKVQTHFPEVEVEWDTAAQSRIHFVEDEIDRVGSGLHGGRSFEMSYTRAIEPAGCDADPIPKEDILCAPINDRWYFTRDGGLHAPCQLKEPGNLLGPDIEWMGYRDNSNEALFGMSISTRFDEGNFMNGGIHVRNDILSLADERKAGVLTHSGHSLFDLAPGSERPGTSSYQNGLSDYAGLNLRCDDQQYTAVSRIAGQEVPPYPLENTSKYYLRPGGASGLHLGSSIQPITLTALGGAEFELTALRLSFLDGLNVFSGVDGTMAIPFPSDFLVNLEQIKFGPQMQFDSAIIASDQEPIELDEWDLECEPLALDFPQPDPCDPGDGFPRLTCSAVLTGITNSSLVGPLAFWEGNILAEADPEAGDIAPLSRFAISADLSIQGPGDSTYRVTPMNGISVNKRPNSNPAPPPNWEGLISVGGLIDLPFFVDLPVVMASSSRNVGPTPILAVRKPWADLSEEEGQDLVHRGLPPGVIFDDYRTLEAHDPEVFRDWQDLIKFNYPVVLEADGYFRARQPKVDDFFLFKFAQVVKSISPENAELTFDAETAVDFENLLPQINLAGLLNNVTGDFSLLDGAFDSVDNLDQLLTDNPDELLKPALTSLIDDALPKIPIEDLTINDLQGVLNQLKINVPSLLTGQDTWLDDIKMTLNDVRQGLLDLKSILESASQIGSLANQLSAAVAGEPTPDLPEDDLVEENLAPVVALIDQIVAQLNEVESALNGDLLNDVLAQSLALATMEIDGALAEIQAKWTNPLVLANATCEELIEDMTCAVSEQLLGSSFFTDYTELMWQNFGDPRDLARQAMDDAIRKIEHYLIEELGNIANPQEALGELGDFMAAATLRGYARINGDSLHEVRVDGSADIAVTEDQSMAFDAWFLFRNLESSTPGTDDGKGELECLKAAGVKAEVAMGAEADIGWGDFMLGIAAAAKVAIGEENTPIGFTADFALLGEFDFGEVALNELKLGVGAGAGNGYFYGAASGKISVMSVSVGVFLGLTCDTGVIANADPDIGATLLAQNISVPVAGVVVYAEGGISLLPLIGINIQPSCLLDVRLHGGQGFIFLVNKVGDVEQITAGVKMLQGVSAELLCLANVRGDFATTIIGTATVNGSRIVFDSLSGAATGSLEGKIGIGVFSVGFEVMARLIITIDNEGRIDWEFDT